MHKYILDASALRAVIHRETGVRTVEDILPVSIMSAVNYAEVATILNTMEMPRVEREEMISDLVPEVVPFEEKHALLAADLKSTAKHKGLSLGEPCLLSFRNT